MIGLRSSMVMSKRMFLPLWVAVAFSAFVQYVALTEMLKRQPVSTRMFSSWAVDSNVAPTTPMRPFHRVVEEVHYKATAPDHYGNEPTMSTSSFNQATIVQRAPWYHGRKQCRKTCCVETVAVSLQQEDHKIVNTGDGKDLADLMLENFPRPSKHLKYHAQHYHPDLLPCLVEGTAIYLENEPKIVIYFWNTIRPLIKAPYSLILSGTDFNSPGKDFYDFLADPLLQGIYGTNPNITDSVPYSGKYHPMYLGLGRNYPQEQYLAPYLELNNYQNPFRNKSKWNLETAPLDFDQDVFVHFGLRKESRIRLWDSLCGDTTHDNHQVISCHKDTSNIPVHQIYASMSKYRFGVSPKGHGWDCYRTYELLLLGIIPIVEDRSAIGGHRLFQDLPVIQLKMLHQNLTRDDFVRTIQDYVVSDEFQKTDFDKGWEKLFLKYTRRKLLKDTGRDKEIIRDGNGNEYYQGYKYTFNGVSSHEHPDPIFCHEKDNCKVPGNRVNDDWFRHPKEISNRDKEFQNLISYAWKGRKEIKLG